MNGTALLRHALALASVGLKPVSMASQSKRPARKGWRTVASLDHAAIVAAFNAAPHADALGIAAGDGVFVIDLDRNHRDGADGVVTFSELIARYGATEPLTLGPRVRTPAAGAHLYFATPPDHPPRWRCRLIGL